MSAIVCGKRSFFEDLPSSPTSVTPPVAKKLRCSSSSSPVQFSQFSHSSTLLEQLRALFPDMDKQLLDRALQECNNDLDLSIKSLQALCFGYEEGGLSYAVELNTNIRKGTAIVDGDAAPSSDPSAESNNPVNGAEWVELFVREIMSTSSIDDARSRAFRVLERLEKYIIVRTGAEAAQMLLEENIVLKEQIEVILRENNILKRAVAIQHERQKEYDGRNQELQHLKQLVSQYEEQFRTLEVNNYALTMHLRQAHQSSSIPGRFHPDVF